MSSRGFDALKFRDYRLFALGMVVFTLGSQMMSVAVGWEIYERTGSASALGLVGLVQAIPIILLALPAGHTADRFDRKRILQCGLTAIALCAIGLAVVSLTHAPLIWMYALLLSLGAARAFTTPARQAFLPQLVPLEHLGNAVTWNSSGFEIASITGPMLGGFLLALTKNYALIYGSTAFCALFYAFFVTLIPKRPRKPTGRDLSLKTLFSGIEFVWDTKLMLAAITLDLFAVLFGGAVALLPIFAKDILHTDATGLGWLRAAPSIGAFTMAMLTAWLPQHRSPHHNNAGKALLWAVVGFGAATIGFGLSRSFWFSIAMLFLAGAFDNISVVIRMTLEQTLTPDEMRGKVSAVNNVFISSSNELGAFESGVTAAAFGPIASVVGGGIGTILVVLAVAWKWPELRRLKSITSQPTT